MDLLGNSPVLNLFDESWRIYARHAAHGPHFISGEARVYNSCISAGCEILGTVRNSVLGPGVKVARGASVCDSVIMNDVVIEEGAEVNYSIIDHDVTIGKGAKVGEIRRAAHEITVIGEGIKIDENGTVAEGAMLYAD